MLNGEKAKFQSEWAIEVHKGRKTERAQNLVEELRKKVEAKRGLEKL